MECALGFDLYALAYRITQRAFRKARRASAKTSPQQLFESTRRDTITELYLRTKGCIPNEVVSLRRDILLLQRDGNIPLIADALDPQENDDAMMHNLCRAVLQQIRDITIWFVCLRDCFSRLQESLRREKDEIIKEVGEVSCSMHPSGGGVQELKCVFLDIAELLSVSVDRKFLAICADYHIQQLTATHSPPHLSATQITALFVSVPLLMKTLVPPRWWHYHTTSDLSAKHPLVRVDSFGLRLKPHPSIAIAYKLRTCPESEVKIDADPEKIFSQSVKHLTTSTRLRVLRLDRYFDPQRPPSGVTQIAKKIAKSQGSSVLSETDATRFLLQLQRLAKEELGAEIKKRVGGVDLQDDEPEDDDEEENGEGGDHNTTTFLRSASADSQKGTSTITDSTATTGSSGTINKADLGLLYRDPERALENVDLNGADELTTKEFKAKMDEKFKSNILRPGDKGYTYDKRVNVKPTEKSEWDDE